ncbi:MAG: HNH endonuclease [Betaproteobacteria bacterium]|nr:HNH endonuclease [Betaproteobacteria bacterium]
MCNKHYRRAFKAGRFEPVFGLPIALRLSRGSVRNDKTGCIEWTGSKNRKGYGKIGIGSNTKLTTHRVAWGEAHGPIPNGMCVLHRCDNPACINIEHLFLGTFADNHKDMDAKGRRGVLRGHSNGSAKLTKEQVLKIRSDSRTLRKIAEDYGLSFSHVGAIKRGNRWGHLTKNRSMKPMEGKNV